MNLTSWLRVRTPVLWNNCCRVALTVGDLPVGQAAQNPPQHCLFTCRQGFKPHILVMRVSLGLLIFPILYSMFKSMKWSALILMNVAMAPVGGLLALFGVSVQVGVIMVEYINQLRVRGHTIFDAAVEGAVLRLRPIMMTMLVAMLGLLPAATSHGIGSDSQRPFAIVIVGGLMAALPMSIFLLPTLYVRIAGEHDILPAPEGEFE